MTLERTPEIEIPPPSDDVFVELLDWIGQIEELTKTIRGRIHDATAYTNGGDTQ